MHRNLTAKDRAILARNGIDFSSRRASPVFGSYPIKEEVYRLIQKAVSNIGNFEWEISPDSRVVPGGCLIVIYESSPIMYGADGDITEEAYQKGLLLRKSLQRVFECRVEWMSTDSDSYAFELNLFRK